jgi:sulfur carrier protein ThiS
MTMNGTITLVSNRDKGQMTNPSIPTNMSLESLLHAELGVVDPDKFQVVVDGTAVNKKDLSTHKLKGGEFVIIVPLNVKGN